MIKKTLILWAMLQGAAYAGGPIPEQIKVPEGYSPVLTVHAKGDQIYQCSLKNGEYSWETQAPDAKLFDEQDNIVGNHTAGPVWEYKEGSRVFGRVVKKIDMAPDSAISWLLVEVVSHKGDGLFSNVSFINRINTHGGLSPSSGCDANHMGAEKRVPYTADYVFYGK
ncbi:MAG: DUF3455 domain-containing protein [Methylobacter sp.]